MSICFNYKQMLNLSVDIYFNENKLFLVSIFWNLGTFSSVWFKCHHQFTNLFFRVYVRDDLVIRNNVGSKKKNLIFIFDIVCSVGVHKVSELEEFQKRMESSQLKTFNLTKSDLVKDHLRYLVNILWMNFNFFLVI